MFCKADFQSAKNADWKSALRLGYKKPLHLRLMKMPTGSRRYGWVINTHFTSGW